MRGLMKLLWERFRIYLAYPEFPLWNPLSFCTIFNITCVLIAHNGGFVPVNIHECDIQVGQHPVIAWLSSNSFRSLGKKSLAWFPLHLLTGRSAQTAWNSFAVNAHCCSKAPLKRDLKSYRFCLHGAVSQEHYFHFCFSPSLSQFLAYD